jgi:hypothetical protein
LKAKMLRERENDDQNADDGYAVVPRGAWCVCGKPGCEASTACAERNDKLEFPFLSDQVVTPAAPVWEAQSHRMQVMMARLDVLERFVAEHPDITAEPATVATPPDATFEDQLLLAAADAEREQKAASTAPKAATGGKKRRFKKRRGAAVAVTSTADAEAIEPKKLESIFEAANESASACNGDDAISTCLYAVGSSEFAVPTTPPTSRWGDDDSDDEELNDGPSVTVAAAATSHDHCAAANEQHC